MTLYMIYLGSFHGLAVLGKPASSWSAAAPVRRPAGRSRCGRVSASCPPTN